MQIVKKIFEVTKPYWPRVILGIVFGLMVSGITGAIVWLVKPALDIVLVEKRFEYLKLIPLGIFVLFTIKGTLNFRQAYLMRSAGLRLIRDTLNKLHSHILYIPVGYFHQEASGIVISRVIEDREVHEKVVVNGTVGYLKKPIEHYTYRTISDYIKKWEKKAKE